MTYCTQNSGDCETCSLVNYGRDCHNAPLLGDKISVNDALNFAFRPLPEYGRIDIFGEPIIGIRHAESIVDELELRAKTIKVALGK